MEEADARLQEVVASLLNEHGGNYEPALRQTFACLHNSGLYEAQSPQEEAQREQQVIAVFRSFPFRTAASAVAANIGADGPAEETQAPPPAYETVYGTNGNNDANANDNHSTHNNINNSWNNGREPEEAGEITAAEGDPENVGEYPNGTAAAAAAVPEALPPLYPAETHGEEASAPGPEVSHQQGEQQLPSVPPHQQQALDVNLPRALPQEAEPEGSAAAAAATLVEISASAAQDLGSVGLPPAYSSLTSGGGVQEGAGQEWGESAPIESGGGVGGAGDGYPETGDGGTEELSVGIDIATVGVHGEGDEGDRGREENKTVDDAAAVAEGHDNGGVIDVAAVVDWPGTGVPAGDVSGYGNGTRVNLRDDPESTGLLNNEQQHQAGAVADNVLVNGGGGVDYLVTPAHSAASVRVTEEEDKMGASITDAEASLAAANSAAAAIPTASIPTTTAAAAVVAPSVTFGVVPGASAYARGSGQAVSEPHLKTGGQPLTHENRAESPTGMATDLQDTLKQLKLRRKHRFVVMRIDGTEVVAASVGARGQGPAELRVALPYSDCRYAVYDQEVVTSDGRKTNKLFFFTWLPHNATPHNKMAYSHGKVTVRQRLEGLYDVAASSFADVESALGLVDEDSEDSDIDF